MGFEPFEEKGNQPVEQPDKASESDVQKAKDAAEIQKYETEKIESKRQAVFAENGIKDTEDLQEKVKAVDEKEAQLGKDVIAFENTKAVELSGIQKHKAELEQKTAELNKREQDLTARIQNLAIREQLVSDREELMNSVERQKLEEAEKYNSLVEQLKRGFPRIVSLLGDNANILIKAGFSKLGNVLWDEIEQMEKWSKDGVDQHCNTIVKWMKGEVDDCNKKAVEMARNRQHYREVHWNKIVDNLEAIYNIMPDLRPDYLPKDEETNKDNLVSH